MNILIVGGAGYIGGSLAVDFTSRTDGALNGSTIYAAARSADQVATLSKANINGTQLDVGHAGAIKEVVLRYNIDIAINATVGFDPNISSNIIEALGERRKASGKQTYFIQSSVLACFTKEGGWTFGQVSDAEPLLEKERQIEDYNPVRLTNISIADTSKANDVKSFVMALPHVYGTGRGPWKKLSVNIPAFIRAATADKVVHKLDKDARTPSVHIDDMVSLYRLVVERIIKDQPAASAENEYYFAMAHRSSWWEVQDVLARAMYARDLVTDPEPKIWSSDEEAAEKLGFPLFILPASQKSEGDFTIVNPHRLGWKPEWDEKRYLESIDDELSSVLTLDKGKSTLFTAFS